MDVKTGEIRAISNLGITSKGTYYEKLNYAVGESHEPGSTFKLMALMAALEDKVVDTATVVDTKQGVKTFYNRKIYDSHRGGYGKISVARAFEVSSNIGLATIDGEMAPSSFGEVSEMRLSREELLKNSGLKEEHLVELEGYGLIAPRGRHYDGDALAIAKAVTEMGGFGIEARHLRSFKSAADREIGLIEQVITPLTRQKSAESKARAEEVQKEIASLSIRLHAALVRGGLNRLR